MKIHCKKKKKTVTHSDRRAPLMPSDMILKLVGVKVAIVGFSLH